MSDDEPTRRVKRGDRYAIVVTCRDAAGAPVDLSGATVRWLARPQYTDVSFETLASSKLPGTGGQVQHVLDGSLAPAMWENEIEATWPGSPPTIITFPTNQEGERQFLLFEVTPDIG